MEIYSEGGKGGREAGEWGTLGADQVFISNSNANFPWVLPAGTSEGLTENWTPNGPTHLHTFHTPAGMRGLPRLGCLTWMRGCVRGGWRSYIRSRRCTTQPSALMGLSVDDVTTDQ